MNSDWDIRYSQYIGDLIIFDERISRIDRAALKSNSYKDAIITIDKNSNKPVMVEIKNADLLFGDLNGMSKQEIIHKVKEYV